MRTSIRFALGLLLIASVPALVANEPVLEYPAGVLDLYDADGSCWVGMDVAGDYPVPVVPAQWLVGPPPSEFSAVTIPKDHWVELLFSGQIVDVDGNDVELTESGRAGEQMLVFLTDGADREYVAGMAQAENTSMQALSYLALELPDIEIPFAPRAMRLVAVDFGGGSPGFDLGYIQAHVIEDCGPQARYPVPVNGAVDVPVDVNLVWTPACDAAQQVVYLSDRKSLVEAADMSVRYAIESTDVNVFEPAALVLDRTYYWRVDAIEANEVSPGEVWSFTTTDHLVIDDFDDYDAWQNFLYQTWKTRSRGSVTLASERLFRSCRQSLDFSYYFDMSRYAETYRNFDPPQDWQGAGGAVLSLWFYGDRDNATQGQMYMALGDGQSEQRVLYDGDVAALTREEWTPWRVALSDFSDVNLAAVTSVGLGLVWPEAQSGQSGRGALYIEDIAVHPLLCLNGDGLTADVTGDCVVDGADFEQMMLVWLDELIYEVPVCAPNEPVLCYHFDGTVVDSAGSAHGLVSGRPTFETGVNGQAIYFRNAGDAVTVPDAAEVFAGIHDAITIAFWQNGDDSSHRNDTLCCSNYTYGVSNPSIAIHLGCWRDPGQYRWDCGSPWSFENRLAGDHRSIEEWSNRWNHWVFTKDTHSGPEAQAGEMRIYLNGVLYDSKSGTVAPIEDITEFTIGSGWYGGYDGLIDDFQIYDYALSEAEAAYLASEGTGVLPHLAALAADLDAATGSTWGDFSILAEQWLSHGLWP